MRGLLLHSHCDREGSPLRLLFSTATSRGAACVCVCVCVCYGRARLALGCFWSEEWRQMHCSGGMQRLEGRFRFRLQRFFCPTCTVAALLLPIIEAKLSGLCQTNESWTESNKSSARSERTCRLRALNASRALAVDDEARVWERTQCEHDHIIQGGPMTGVQDAACPSS